MKRFLCFALTLIFMLSLIPNVSAADDELTYKWLKYKVTGDEIKITGYVADYDFSAENEYDLDEEPVIPDEIDGKAVTAIADFAFEGAPYQYIYGNKNIASIGIGAFYKCDNLRSISRFAHFTSAGESEGECTLLYDENSVMVAAAGPVGRLNTHPAEPMIKSIASYAFAGKYSEVLNLPNVTSVDEKAFMDASIESLSLSSLTEIGVSAFEGAHLTKAYFQNVEKVGERAFAGAKGDIYMYGNAPSFAENAFDGCDDTLTVYYDKNAAGWDKLHFDNITLTGIEPEVFHIRFIQEFEDTGLAEDFFADVELYKGTSLTDKNMPVIPEVEGYFPGKATGQWNSVYEDKVLQVWYNKILYYTVTFIDGVTNEILATQQVKRFDDVQDFPTPPEHEGYVFREWYGDWVNIEKDETVYATYQIITFTVTLIDSLAPSEPFKTLIVNYGEDVIFPEPPKHEGYDFTGWNKDGKNIKADTTIKALYERQVFTVMFIDDLTKEMIAQTKVAYGKDTPSSDFPTIPQHEGYTFAGWSSLGKNITEDTEIYALYKEIQTPEPQTGDVNGDGKVNTGDAVAVLKASAGITTLTSEQEKAGDCNHDGKVNTADAVLILKYAAGMITDF